MSAVSQPSAGLTVRGVRCRSVVVPLRKSIVTKVLDIHEVPLLLVDLFTEEGVTGSCYLFAYTRSGGRHFTSVIEDLVERNRGSRIAPTVLFDGNTRALTLFGHQGIAATAVAALDMCYWDVLAKAAGLPLVELLGGARRPLPAYNSNGLGLSDPDGLGEEALSLLEAGGFNAVKIRLGRDDPRQDLRAVRVVRQAIGERALLPSDYNQGLSVEQAIQRGRMLDGEGIYWIEEPIPYDDLQGQARIAAAIETPIQIGENIYGPRMVADALEQRAADYYMFDVMRIGGVTGWLRAVALCEPQNAPVSTHLFPEISAHLLAVTPTAHWLEYMSWGDAILAAPVTEENGTVTPSATPGTGVAWDEEAVARYLI